MASQLIAVIRHARAGDRESWAANDDLRPLSTRGCEQAERLVEHLGFTPAVILSSPSLRCLATVVPLGRATLMEITTATELYEGGSVVPALQRLIDTGAGVVAACTHGDIVGNLLYRLASQGISLPTTRAEKCGTWLLEVIDGTPRSARYLAPPV